MKLFKRSYPQFTFEDFSPVPGQPDAMVAYFHFTVKGEKYGVPMVALVHEINNPDMMKQLMLNGLEAAHDIVDEMLKRGLFRAKR